MLIFLQKVDLRAERFFKKLVGMKDVEDALQRLDKLTQEETRMAAAEALKITRGIDDKVEGVDERVKNVGTKVEGIADEVHGVDHKVSSVIQGEFFAFISRPPNLSLAFYSFYSIRCKGGWRSDSTGGQSSRRPRPCVTF